MDRKKIVACLTALLLAGCSRPNRIVVGSKNFTEQILLGEILAQQIERRLGVTVERKLNLGGTLLAHEALISGAIDLYPEYTGTALTAVLKQPVLRDPDAVLANVRSAYAEKWRLKWTDPLGFNDTFAMVVRGETARENKLATISDAARLRSWKMGAGYEFKQRPDGLDGLLQTYSLRMDGASVTMDLGLLYSALQSRQVDLIAANSTDGMLSVLDVVVLQDDKHYFPPYQCAPIVRNETLTRYPRLSEALAEIAGRLTDATMRQLNHAIDGEHRSPSQVATDWLHANLGRP